MATPVQIDELDAATSLSAAAAVAVVEGNLTLQTTPRAFINQAASYTPAGAGGVAESAETALRRLVHSGQYSSQANYEQARDVLTGTVGVPSLQVTGTLSVSAGVAFQNLAIAGTLSVSAGAAVQALQVTGTLSADGAFVMTGTATIAFQPGGRLTLTSATPVTTSDVAGATTVYYTPYTHDRVMLYNGSSGWVQHQFTELSQATTDNTKSPAAVANNSNYDVFVWSDSGTLRATRAPAWTSDTARGTGAGTTELELFEGRYVNKNAITNGPAARRGLYVGTIRSDGSAQVNDTVLRAHVWNTYHRVTRSFVVKESTDTWTYASSSWRQVNASTANQIDIVRGLDEDVVKATSVAAAVNSTASERNFQTGVGVDSTSAFSGITCMNSVANGAAHNTDGHYCGLPGLGRHTIVWLERGDGADTQTFVGDNGLPLNVNTGMTGGLMA